MRYAIVNKNYVVPYPGANKNHSRFPVVGWSKPARKVMSRAAGREVKKLFKNPTDYYIVDTFMKEVVR